MGYSEQVRKVKDIVAARWSQESFFVARRGKVCCCVHGAAQAVCNPKMAELFSQLETCWEGADKTFVSATLKFLRVSSVFVADEGYHKAGDPLPGTVDAFNLKETWKKRTAGTRHTGDFGNNNLHYLLGMFGITASFNDAATTSLPSLLTALDICAIWAEQNEDFLANN